jgi:3-hydroxyacyl-[acyl-carrier-protein] dehydratase
MSDYYLIERETIDGLSGFFAVRLNPDCEVYKGHFPGEPVSPGVCNMQMLLECAEKVIGFPLRARKVNRCRLTTLITPLSHPELELHIELKENEPALWALNAEIGKDADSYMALKAEVIRDE